VELSRCNLKLTGKPHPHLPASWCIGVRWHKALSDPGAPWHKLLSPRCPACNPLHHANWLGTFRTVQQGSHVSGPAPHAHKGSTGL